MRDKLFVTARERQHGPKVHWCLFLTKKATEDQFCLQWLIQMVLGFRHSFPPYTCASYLPNLAYFIVFATHRVCSFRSQIQFCRPVFEIKKSGIRDLLAAVLFRTTHFGRRHVMVHGDHAGHARLALSSDRSHHTARVARPDVLP